MIVSKKIILILIVIIALVIVLFGQENYETEKIMENQFSTCGVSETADIKAETRMGTVPRSIMAKIPFKTSAKAPNKKRYHQTFAWGNQVCCSFDGAAPWIQDPRIFTVNTPSLLRAGCLLH